MKSKEEIKRLCDLCLVHGSRFEKVVAQTVKNRGYKASLKQETVLCSGASCKGGSFVSDWQSSDNDYDRDSY